MKLYEGRMCSEGVIREVRLRADGPCLKAGSRTRYLYASCDGGDETPWQEAFVSDAHLLALSKREGNYLDIRSDEGRKLRRRVEDALRKSEDANVLLTVATLLGVRRAA